MITGSGEREDSVPRIFWVVELVNVRAVRMTWTLNTFAGMMVITPERLLMMSGKLRPTLTL